MTIINIQQNHYRQITNEQPPHQPANEFVRRSLQLFFENWSVDQAELQLWVLTRHILCGSDDGEEREKAADFYELFRLVLQASHAIYLHQPPAETNHKL